MCVIGNPPYSGESVNKGDWIMRLMDAYKKEPGGKEKLNERNPKWINDDYVKFIRFSEYLIERNGDGVLGFITNHGYLDNPTFRGMRWHLLDTFDKLYVLDLHGNAKKKEVTPEGKPDKNVFDIQQGVSIIIGVKKRGAKEKKPLAEVFHADLWGERAAKYEALRATGLSGKLWQRLKHRAPQYPLTRRDYGAEAAYRAGFGVQEFMPVNSVGIVTARDALTIDMDKQVLWDRVQDFAALAPEVAREKYKLGDDAQDWGVATAQADVKKNFAADLLVPIYYRPFDIRWTYFTGTSRGFQCRPREEVMRHLNANKNFGLGVCRQSGVNKWAHVSICDALVDDSYISNRSKERGYVAPLYLYPADQDLDKTRRVNFDPSLYNRLQTLAANTERGTPDELAVFDYIYGVLHCPAYRATYVEFLKIDFPRIPWPATPAEFWDVSDKGGRLRRLHLMEPQAIGETPFPFKGEGDAVVNKPRFEGGKVWINETQYFDAAPEVSWDFYIGGYQPAQKWLKDRKGRALSFEDVKHYQRILKILSETDRIMRTITMTLDAGEE
jgi:predicted helicase